MSINIPQLDKFGLSRRLGFLGDRTPVCASPNHYYAPWDDILTDLPELISSKKLKQKVDRLPVLDPSKLSSDHELQHAYVALAFIIHAYIWGGSTCSSGQPLEIIPPQLSDPFLEVCKRIDTRPVLSYSGLCIWNWTASKGQMGDGRFPDLEDLSAIGSFTGSKGEDAFYLVPVLIEAEGGRLVQLLLDAIAAASCSDFEKVKMALEATKSTLKAMGQHLFKLFATLDAQMFYHQLRPFYSGGKGAESKGLPRGVVFQRSDGSEEEVHCIGGSAAQSSLFPFLDSVLGVVHEGVPGEQESVFQEMRSYMPGKHRQFLEEVALLPSIRSFVEKRPSDIELRNTYDECLMELRSWRGKHIAIVSKYIVQPARAAAKLQTANGVVAEDAEASFQAEDEEQLRGTGGSSLIPFLRQARDETVGVGQEQK